MTNAMKKTAIARLLNVHPNTVTRMLDDGRLSAATLDATLDHIRADAYDRARRDLLAHLESATAHRDR